MVRMDAAGPGTWEWRSAAGGTRFWGVRALEALGWAAAFSSRLGGCSPEPWTGLNLGLGVGDDPARVGENRRRWAAAAGFNPAAVSVLDQVHGTRVVRVDGPGAAGAADGQCTDQVGVVLAVGVADCAAIYLVDARRGVAALCHAGWRGLVADIPGSALRAMGEEFGSRAADVVAAVSPCIGPCCYEVDGPVIEALRAAAPWAEEVLAPTHPGHARLDLGATARRRLIAAGIPPGRIALAGLCTACEEGRLFSHRRDRGRTGRMQAVLWMP